LYALDIYPASKLTSPQISNRILATHNAILQVYRLCWIQF